MQTVIFNYGSGTPQRLALALERAGHSVTLTGEPEGVRGRYALVLPDLHDDDPSLTRGIRDGTIALLKRHIENERPLLATGFGLQLLLSGRAHEQMPAGLGVFNAQNMHFDARMADDAERPLKVPHTGFSYVVGLDRHPSFKSLVPESESGVWFYFRHRLCAPARVPFAEVAVAHHGVPFAGAIWRDNIMATQFLPELSGTIGIDFLRAWKTTLGKA